MDFTLMAVGGVAIVAIIVALFLHFKSRAVAAVETIEKDTGLELFTVLHAQIVRNQKQIDDARNAAMAAQTKFKDAQDKVAAMTLPPVV